MEKKTAMHLTNLDPTYSMCLLFFPTSYVIFLSVYEL